MQASAMPLTTAALRTFDAVWAACKPVNGLITAAHASAALKQSRLSNDALKKVWEQAKSKKTQHGAISKAEFEHCCRLVVEAGGDPIVSEPAPATGR
jgi:hypothetical protein